MSKQKEELLEERRLRRQLAGLLEATANAVHGGPLPDGYWSFHDLAERVTNLRDLLSQSYAYVALANTELAARINRAIDYKTDVARVVKAASEA